MNILRYAILFSLTVARSKAWAPLLTPTTTATTESTSRRNFVASSIAGTVLMGTSFEAKARSTNSLSLVSPNSLDGKVFVITGASTGIGLESGKALAKGGATLVLTARSDKKGQAAVDTVQKYLREEGVQNDKVYFAQLDLDNLDNVKSFPERYRQRMGDTKIDVLMNNAGVMAIPDRQLTNDGFERTFQSN